MFSPEPSPTHCHITHNDRTRFLETAAADRGQHACALAATDQEKVAGARWISRISVAPGNAGLSLSGAEAPVVARSIGLGGSVMWCRSVNARLSAIGISTFLVIGLTASAFAEQARRLRIAENDAPRPTDRIFLAYNYYANAALEGGFSTGETSGGINNQLNTIGFEKTFFGADISFGVRIPFQGTEPPLALGVKFRTYFGDEGDPNQALTHYSRDWMVMPYVGMPIVFIPPGQPQGGNAFVITPFVGPIFEHGELSIFNNQGHAPVTRHGLGVGLNFDVVLPAANGFQPFIGFGGQLSAMQKVNKNIDGFDVRLEDKVEARAVARGGVSFR